MRSEEVQDPSRLNFTQFAAAPFGSSAGSGPPTKSPCHYERNEHAACRTRFWDYYSDVHLVREEGLSYFKERKRNRPDITHFIEEHLPRFRFIRVAREVTNGQVETLFGYVKNPGDRSSRLDPEMILGVLAEDKAKQWCFDPLLVRYEEIVELLLYTFKVPVLYHGSQNQSSIEDALAAPGFTHHYTLSWFNLNPEPSDKLSDYRERQPVVMVASALACQRNLDRIEILLAQKVPLYIFQPPRIRHKEIIGELYRRRRLPESLITQYAHTVSGVQNLYHLVAQQIQTHFRLA